MRLRALIVVSVFIIVLMLDRSSATEDEINLLSNSKHSTSSDEHKLALECQHSDYRTYIKCLRRQKRHHGHNNHHNETGGSRTCFEECGMDLCTSTKCLHDCHTRCLKKTKETRQIITQYETECTSNDCNKSELPTTNITTNIDINNIIHNHMTGADDKNNRTSHNWTPNNGNSNNTGVNNGGFNNGNFKCKPGNCCPGCCGGCSQNMPGLGLTLVPQIQLVPQITYGIGMGPIAGCLFSMTWPCLQTTSTLNQPMPFDCSQCGNPVFRYNCETSCYNMVSKNAPDPSGRDGSNRSICQSPNCIGGSQ